MSWEETQRTEKRSQEQDHKDRHKTKMDELENALATRMEGKGSHDPYYENSKKNK